MSLPSGWMLEWLDADPDLGVTEYELRCFDERERPSDAHVRVASMIVHCKVDARSLARLMARAGFTSIARLAPSRRPQGRHGDFGEVVALGLMAEFTDLDVPVIKLRVQMDPEQSLHGTDIVGFRCTNGMNGLVVAGLEFVEVKCRTTGDKQQAAKAHQQLVDDRSENFADTLEFVHQRLCEADEEELLDAYEGYLARREGEPGDSYRLILIFDSAVWSGEELDHLPEGEELLRPLSVDVVRVTELREFIDETWASVDPALASSPS